MPNRIIKDSLLDSEKIAQLNDFEFRLWVGLILQADDAGRGDARPAYIKGHVFTFRDRVTLKDIDAAFHALAAYSCVDLYTVGGRPYYAFPNWAKHQRIRDCKPKYPGPEEADNVQSAAACGDLPQSAATCGDLPPESNPIQSEYNPNPNTSEERADKPRRARKFEPPSVAEVREYCIERKNTVDAEHFVDYYTANGWKQGSGKPIVDWRAAVRTWERRDNATRSVPSKTAGWHSKPETPAAAANTREDIANMRKFYERMGGGNG